MRILVTGANGQLGSEMRLLAKNSADEFLFTDVNQVEGQKTVFLDITDRQAVLDMVQTHGIDAIVNCAAWTNVDACETDPELAALAMRLNADAPENLALAMKAAGGLLIHISTDYVFGTEPYNTPYREDQQGTPTGVYGRTKKEGEERILATGCQYVIIRTAWLYSEFGKNFCKTMLQLTAERPTLNVVYDQCGTPTYALDLARAICTILQDYNTSLTAHHILPPIEGRDGEGSFLPYPKTGIYHYSNLGVCSWYDFTQMIQQTANTLCTSAEAQRHCDIRPCLSSQYPSPVKRPSYSVLDKTKIQEAFHLDIPYWTDSLRQCIANLIQTEK
ncbi:MAG: dTDP-4-dehydrorhamnose reductase [Bacteroidaceae bacterium]|nr:dTDP-4-dehydrorhamnose reductase [Bacteroidaceae bacterium]